MRTLFRRSPSAIFSAIAPSRSFGFGHPTIPTAPRMSPAAIASMTGLSGSFASTVERTEMSASTEMPVSSFDETSGIRTRIPAAFRSLYAAIPCRTISCARSSAASGRKSTWIASGCRTKGRS